MIRCPVAVLLVVAVAGLQAEPAPKTKDKTTTITDKAKQIHVVTDRKETIKDFFQRQRIVVGTVLGADKVLRAKETLKMQFISYSSFNDDAKKMSLFGAYLEIALPSKAVRDLISEDDPKKKGGQRFKGTLILRRDDKNDKLYHIVGYMKHSPVGFFQSTKKISDEFTAKDLHFKEKK